jgi:hypothetical protein
MGLKWYLIGLILLFGLIFLVTALLAKSSTIGKFTKKESIVIGMLLTGISLYLSK